VLSAVACFKAGGRGGPENYTDIAQGPLLLRHVDDIYGHPNSVVGLCLTGAQVSLWLERSFSLFHQILPATQDAQLINTGFPSFNFDIIWGVTFEVDLTQPARFDSKGTEVAPGSQRIKNLRSQGQPINYEQSFILVTNSYRVGTGGGFAGANTTQTIHADGTLTRDVLRDYLANEPSFVSAQRSRLWRFCPIAQASVIFDTSPKAALYLPDYPDLNVKALERQANGFQRFRLYL
jgi:2',3'-cyclic-nucleotide 2'-phosphodiesterase/3'-nucleotidase